MTALQLLGVQVGRVQPLQVGEQPVMSGVYLTVDLPGSAIRSKVRVPLMLTRENQHHHGVLAARASDATAQSAAT